LLAGRKLFLQDCDPTPPVERAMTGYFTLFSSLRVASSLDHLEHILGYRAGRLSNRGVAVYSFLRLPKIDEFELRAYSIVPEHKWEETFGAERRRQLAAEELYNRNTGLPSFDERQRRDALEKMTSVGADGLVKLYPRDFQANESYPSGEGAPQWRLTDNVSRSGAIRGALKFLVRGGAPPWRK
jgi:hypothetical protein